MTATSGGRDKSIGEFWNGKSTVRVAALSKNSNPKSTGFSDRLPPPPEPQDFASQEEYEEAKGYYGSHIARIRKMAERARTSQDSSEK